MIPEFSAILKADKGSKGDSEGRKKLLARKQLAYIYFMKDFRSPIYGWDDEEKHKEALRYTDLTDTDTELVLIQDALRVYDEMQYQQARSLKTLDAARKGLAALDTYLNNIDFTQVDKQGKLLHSPKEYVTNLQQLNKAYDELEKFEQRVHKDLQENATIRGNATLGDKENKKGGEAGTWDESGSGNSAAPSFSDISVMMNKSKQVLAKDDEEEEL